MPSKNQVENFLSIIELAQKRTEHGNDGVTTEEISEASGQSVLAVRRALRLLISRGMAKCVGGRPIASIDGRRTRVPIYQVVKPAKPKK